MISYVVPDGMGKGEYSICASIVSVPLGMEFPCPSGTGVIFRIVEEITMKEVFIQNRMLYDLTVRNQRPGTTLHWWKIERVMTDNALPEV